MRWLKLRIRLLPVTLIAAALVLSLKLTEVWRDVAALRAPSVVAEAVAEEAKSAPETPAEPKPEPKPPAGNEPAAEPKAAEAAAPDLAKLLPGDPMPLTQTEIELLQKLASRREALDARERELDMREGLLRAAEQQLQAKTAELTGLQAKIEAAMKKRDEQQEQKLAGLVSIYEKMKSKDAARIFNDLDMDILVDLLVRMKDAKTAPILADMDAEKARIVTARMAERHAAATPPPAQ